MGLWEPPSQKPAGGAAHPGHLLSCSPNWPLCVQVENEELRHLLWSSVVFYQTPGLEVTACVLLSMTLWGSCPIQRLRDAWS